MATILGGITTSRVRGIGGNIAKGLQNAPYWKPFFDGFVPVRKWLAEVKPDVAVVFYNDHGLKFFLDKMPTFAVGAAPIPVCSNTVQAPLFSARRLHQQARRPAVHAQPDRGPDLGHALQHARLGREGRHAGHRDADVAG
jgi:hypothetical protein